MAALNKKVCGTPPNAIYIGRRSKWGNPFRLHNEKQRDQVCEQYRQYLWEEIQGGRVALHELASLRRSASR
jgi:hypothetical protein